MKYITLLNKVRKMLGLKIVRKIPFIPERDIVLPTSKEIAEEAVKRLKIEVSDE
jgi:hypothetical protein